MSVEECTKIVDFRCNQLNVPRELIVDVQYGDASETFPGDDHLGATVVGPGGKQWMILISDKTPVDQLDEVVTHEVLHVFYQLRDEEDFVHFATWMLCRLERIVNITDEMVLAGHLAEMRWPKQRESEHDKRMRAILRDAIEATE